MAAAFLDAADLQVDLKPVGCCLPDYAQDAELSCWFAVGALSATGFYVLLAQAASGGEAPVTVPVVYLLTDAAHAAAAAAPGADQGAKAGPMSGEAPPCRAQTAKGAQVCCEKGVLSIHPAGSQQIYAQQVPPP